MLDVEHTCISTVRLQHLCREELHANMLKAVIANAYENYETIDRNTLKVLYTMFIGKKEEDDV